MRAPDEANLAALHLILGRTEEADREIQRALATMENAFGPDHLAVGASLANYAFALLRTGIRLDVAELYFKRSIAIVEKAQGPTSPNLARALEGYAAVLRKGGREDEARDVEARAKAVREPQN
jgi:tetratricopeptide (TPR) repeat protein